MGGNGLAEGEKPPKAKPIWARFLAASLVIVVSMAAATSISILVYFTDIAAGLRDNGQYENLKNQLSEVEGGDPQTILILGSDKRLGAATKGDPGRSDTTILLRVNPDTNQINLLSIPRDLEVNIPNHGNGKFNEAFSYGGPKLTLRVVENLTGLEINHLVNINFTGFADAVDAIDCVYIDVDHHYFNDNSTALSVSDQYAEIDIEAGYQRLCGLKALQYVRYRHTDNDLVRSARQQDFLREARQKVPPETLIRDRDDLLKIFTDYTTSDISDAVTVLELMKTLIAARDAELREIHFPANLGDGTTGFVTASEPAIQKAVQEFLGNEPVPEPSAARGWRRFRRRRRGRRQEARERGVERAQRPADDRRHRTGAAGGAEARRRRSARTATRCSSSPSSTRPAWCRSRRSTTTRGRSRSTAPATTSTTATRSSSTVPVARSRPSTTASRAPTGRTRRSSPTPASSGRSTAATTSSTTTAAGCG